MLPYHHSHCLATTFDLSSGELKESLAKLELNEEKLVVVTTVNARNIVNATELLHWQHFGCFAHTEQGVKKVMKLTPISKAFGRGQNLVSHFHHSTKSSYVLEQKQRLVYR